MSEKKTTKKPAGKKKAPAKKKSTPKAPPAGFAGSAWGTPYEDEAGRTVIDHFKNGQKDKQVILSIPPELLEKELASYPAPPEIPEGYVIVGEFEAPAGSVVTIPPSFDLIEDDRILSKFIPGESPGDARRVKVIVLRREEDSQESQDKATDEADSYLKNEALEEAVSEARNFASLAEDLLRFAKGGADVRGTALAGAVRRRSLDLSQALIKYRKAGYWWVTPESKGD